MIDEELNKAADEHIRKVVDIAGHPGWDWTTQDIADAFIAGAKWQKQHDAELIEIAYNDGITIGMTKQKEQMMKEAVEAKIYGYDDGSFELIASWLDMPNNSIYKDGDKVRIIIVKEEEQ